MATTTPDPASNDVNAGGTPRGVAGVAASPAEVVRHEERLTIGTEWVRSGRVRVRRRVVTERRTVEVEVRREVLELEGDDVDFRDGHLVGTDLRGPVVTAPTDSGPVVVVLREEVPEVVLRVAAYERVTVSRSRVEDTQVLEGTLAHEEVDVSEAGGTRPV